MGGVAVALSVATLLAAGTAVAGTPAASVRTMDARAGSAQPDASFSVALVRSGYDNLSWVGSPRGSTTLFVAEQRGVIRIVGRTTPFLDIQDRVLYRGEQGLLGVAFHPSYSSNGRFFVYYTGNDGHNYVKEYRRASATAASRTERPILRIPHPTHTNHNGGMITFGADGMLFIATGDGGGAGDPAENGQKRTTLLGKLLRIDVNVASGYRIPPGNPYASSSTYRREIWSYGLRNPWRFSFDGWTLWLADVGQGSREEVNRSYGDGSRAWPGGRGRNYGWNEWEGTLCYEGPCSRNGKTFPIAEYRTHDAGRCAVTGGYVHKGHYFFADYCGGQIYSIPAGGSAVTLRRDTAHNISSFGKRGDGVLYFVTAAGAVYRIDFTP
jgi:glucose/arabinose dehydrogenase